jgi:glycosyltransferase involved in cell wall biosynthesis
MADTRAIKIRLAYDDAIAPNCEKRIIIKQEASYEEAITYINESHDIDLVSLQHEFGLFGGNAGSFAVTVAKQLRKPLIATLHTVRADMGWQKRQVIGELAAHCSRVVVMTEESADRLNRDCGVPGRKVVVIPQGIPEVGFATPESSDLRQNLDAGIVFVSAGYLRHTKGYHIALEALAKYRQVNPDFKYLILGTHQPQFFADAWYRGEVERVITELRLGANVVRADAYLSREDLLDQILAADIGLVTYTEQEQNASGILPLLLGCGRVVVSTAFAYAQSIQRHVDGLFLTEMNNPENVFRTILQITEQRELLKELMARNYRATRDWLWSSSAARYRQVFEEAVANSPSSW